ncbi:MAG: AAA-like domain-containing protein [Oscillospiraceae bacterium]|nr:AAA-like domain-containing protein [Oscillospiraceae bacterium]
MKRFNVTGICVPGKDYMVDISGKIAQIKKLVDDGSYFTINRARQYGKTTTLYELRKRLANEYLAVKISFEGLGDESFESAEKFCPMFVTQIVRALKSPSVDVEQEYIEKWNRYVDNFDFLSEHIAEMCHDKKVVLMIDEVDRTSNNRVFLQFLSMLRKKYLACNVGDDYTFHSVILVGVYDVKNIKLKMINEGLYTPSGTENKIYNSPWNIAVSFKVDMSFCPEEIATMLGDYESDYNTGMDIAVISKEIHSYTSGYPFLVSRVCQCIDEELDKIWTIEGVKKAVDILLKEKNMLFDDLSKNIETYADLKKILYELLFLGQEKVFNINNPTINLGHMFGYLANENNKIKVSNSIFEIMIYNYFISEDEVSGETRIRIPPKSEIAENGRFNMELCLQKFAQRYAEMYKLRDAEFLERHGGLLFMTYLKPLINGHGFCHIESQTNDFKIDIIVDYDAEQFIIELKIWHGQKLHEAAYKQLANYLKLKNADTGYLLSFDFRRESNKDKKTEWIDFDGKKIFDVIV